MINIIKWYENHYRGLSLVLACIVVLFGVIANMSIMERKASEKIHAKLNYESELVKFLLIEQACNCCDKCGKTK